MSQHNLIEKYALGRLKTFEVSQSRMRDIRVVTIEHLYRCLLNREFSGYQGLKFETRANIQWPPN